MGQRSECGSQKWQNHRVPRDDENFVRSERLIRLLTENRTETAKTLLAKEIEKLSEQKRQVVERFIHRGRIARNVAREFEERLTFGQRLASSRSKCWNGLLRET